jgi:hypothetical protein
MAVVLVWRNHLAVTLTTMDKQREKRKTTYYRNNASIDDVTVGNIKNEVQKACNLQNALQVGVIVNVTASVQAYQQNPIAGTDPMMSVDDKLLAEFTLSDGKETQISFSTPLIGDFLATDQENVDTANADVANWLAFVVGPETSDGITWVGHTANDAQLLAYVEGVRDWKGKADGVSRPV